MKISNSKLRKEGDYILQVYTSQYKYKGEDRYDITVKTSDKTFAPTWDMVMGTKQGKMTYKEYTEKYYELMRKSYKNNRRKWDELLNRDRVVLVCFCRPGEFCHRILLAEILVKLGAQYIGEI